MKSHKNHCGYAKALNQAAQYGLQLGLEEIYPIFFIEEIDDENRRKLEAEFAAYETKLKAAPLFVETGE